MKVPGKAKYKGDVTSFFEEEPRSMGPRTFDGKYLLADTWLYDKETNLTIVTFRTIN